MTSVDLQVTDTLSISDCEYIMSVVKNNHELGELSAQEIIDLVSQEGLTEVYSIFIDGKIVAFTGVVKSWLSKGVVYFLPDPNMSKRSFVIVKNVVKHILSISINDDDTIKRLEAHVRADEPGFQSWAEKVGFVRESLMRKWGPDGDDYYMYRMIK